MIWYLSFFWRTCQHPLYQWTERLWKVLLIMPTAKALRTHNARCKSCHISVTICSSLKNPHDLLPRPRLKYYYAFILTQHMYRIFEQVRTSPDRWSVGLRLFFEAGGPLARFFGLSLVRDYLSTVNRAEAPQEEAQKQIRETMFIFVRSSIEQSIGARTWQLDRYIVNNLVSIITLCIKINCPENWPNAFSDLLLLASGTWYKPIAICVYTTSIWSYTWYVFTTCICSCLPSITHCCSAFYYRRREHQRSRLCHISTLRNGHGNSGVQQRKVTHGSMQPHSIRAVVILVKHPSDPLVRFFITLLSKTIFVMDPLQGILWCSCVQRLSAAAKQAWWNLARNPFEPSRGSSDGLM